MGAVVASATDACGVTQTDILYVFPCIPHNVFRRDTRARAHARAHTHTPVFENIWSR